jgi:hypothetical protein
VKERKKMEGYCSTNQSPHRLKCEWKEEEEEEEKEEQEEEERDEKEEEE